MTEPVTGASNDAGPSHRLPDDPGHRVPAHGLRASYEQLSAVPPGVAREPPSSDQVMLVFRCDHRMKRQQGLDAPFANDAQLPVLDVVAAEFGDLVSE